MNHKRKAKNFKSRHTWTEKLIWACNFLVQEATQIMYAFAAGGGRVLVDCKISIDQLVCAYVQFVVASNGKTKNQPPAQS